MFSAYTPLLNKFCGGTCRIVHEQHFQQLLRGGPPPLVGQTLDEMLASPPDPALVPSNFDHIPQGLNTQGGFAPGVNFMQGQMLPS